MMKFIVHFLAYNALEINEKMGFAKTETKETILVTNGVYPVEFNLQFKNQLIDVKEAEKMRQIGDWQCANFNTVELLNEVNAQLSDTFWSIFEPLELDLKSKERSGRGIIATAAIGAGVTLAEKLLGKAVDYLFDSRSRKTEHTVQELKASLHTIKNRLHLSSIELCTLEQQVLKEKIERIGLELSLSIENQVRNEIQKLYFGNLDNSYKLSACLALNENATKYDCLKLIRRSDIDFNILAIEHEGDIATIQLQILTPILSNTIIGHRVFNLGVPLIKDNQYFLAKGSLPDFLSAKSEYSFKIKPKFNVIGKRMLVSNPAVDTDCFKNSTDGDQVCDAILEKTSTS